MGKRELHRHLKQNHASAWHACEYRALELDRQWKPIYGCVCQPPTYTKHICSLYLQFALLRLGQECQLMPQLPAEPPDVILSVVEQIEPLLWLGFAHNLYCRSGLKMNLTMHCQVCGYSGPMLKIFDTIFMLHTRCTCRKASISKSCFNGACSWRWVASVTPHRDGAFSITNVLD